MFFIQAIEEDFLIHKKNIRQNEMPDTKQISIRGYENDLFKGILRVNSEINMKK
jgi:hypothetical protein